MPNVYFAADHAGFALKNALVAYVRMLGYAVIDLGARSFDADDDYPDFVTPLAERVAEEPEARGIVIGGSGQGEAMCANRNPGVRAAIFYGEKKAIASLELEGGEPQDGYDLVRLARRHNNANVLSMSARFVSGEEAKKAVQIFLETPFPGTVRHTRRLAKF